MKVASTTFLPVALPVRNSDIEFVSDFYTRGIPIRGNYFSTILLILLHG